MKCALYRVPLNSGGYDKFGQYWGHGQRLYFWQVDGDPELFGSLRAISRSAAKQHLLDHVDKSLTFYN